MTDADTGRIRDITQRLAEARCERIRAASRLASQLYATVGPLNDPRLLSLIDRLQARLAERLPGQIEGDGPVSG